MWTLTIILAVVSTVVESQTENYSDVCVNHTMIIYPVLGPLCIPAPGEGTILSGVTEGDKELIVNTHNAVRRLVAQGLEIRGGPGPQPPAADMNKLVWDDELANVAQRWADQCNYGHDQCRSVSRFEVGQNLHGLFSSTITMKVDWGRTITSRWYDEVKLFNSSHVSPFTFTLPTSHYTALIWANTTYVGCGFSYFKSTNPRRAKVPYTKYFVCNYGPIGNNIDGTMYTVGEACSQCSAGKTCENSLCA